MKIVCHSCNHSRDSHRVRYTPGQITPEVRCRVHGCPCRSYSAKVI